MARLPRAALPERYCACAGHAALMMMTGGVAAPCRRQAAHFGDSAGFSGSPKRHSRNGVVEAWWGFSRHSFSKRGAHGAKGAKSAEGMATGSRGWESEKDAERKRSRSEGLGAAEQGGCLRYAAMDVI